MSMFPTRSDNCHSFESESKEMKVHNKFIYQMIQKRKKNENSITRNN